MGIIHALCQSHNGTGVTDMADREGSEGRDMKRTFVIYAKNFGHSDVEALFDTERFGPNSHDGFFLPVGVFLPKSNVESEWLNLKNESCFLRVNKNTVYDALDVLNDKASEHVDRLWNILDVT